VGERDRHVLSKWPAVEHRGVLRAGYGAAIERRLRRGSLPVGRDAVIEHRHVLFKQPNSAARSRSNVDQRAVLRGGFDAGSGQFLRATLPVGRDKLTEPLWQVLSKQPSSATRSGSNVDHRAVLRGDFDAASERRLLPSG